MNGNSGVAGAQKEREVADGLGCKGRQGLDPNGLINRGEGFGLNFKAGLCHGDSERWRVSDVEKRRRAGG